MFKFSFNKLNKIIFMFLFYMFCFINVNALKMINVEERDIYRDCNMESGCVPLCVYSSNDGEYNAIIGYFYEKNDSNSNWIIAYEGKIDGYRNFSYEYAFSGVNPPTDSIYLFPYDKSHTNPWKDSEIYNSLNNKFKCPDFISYGFSVDNTIEGRGYVAFGNNGMGKYSFTNQKKFDFIDGYLKVAKDAYDDLLMYDKHSKNDSNDEVSFLSNFDSNIKYDSNLSFEENSKNNCEYIKKYSEDTRGIDKAYINSVILTDENINNYNNEFIDSALKKAIQKNGISLNTYVYRYSSLKKIMTNGSSTTDGITKYNYKEIGLYDNKPMFGMLDTLLQYNAAVSLNNIVDVCNSNYNYKIKLNVDTNDDGVADNSTFNDLVNSIRDFPVSSDFQIVFDDEYDCSFLTDVADIISDAYFILELAGLAILIVLSVLDYTKVFLNDNADELKKANSTFIKRLVLAVVLFLLPAVVNFSLRIFNIEGFNSSDPLCVKISNK